MPRGVDTAGQWHQQIVPPVHDQAGCPDGLQQRNATAAGHNGRHMPGVPGRVKTTLIGRRHLVPQFLITLGETGTTDKALEIHRRFNRGLYKAHIALKESPGDLTACPRKFSVAAGGHNGGEGPYPVGKLRRYQLRDHSAHGDAGEVHLLQPESIDNATGVMCHVIELIGDPKGAAQGCGQHHTGRAGHNGRGHFFGQTDIAVVVPYDTKAALGQAMAQGQRPCRHLGGHTHNQQYDRIRRLAKFVVGDTNTVCFQILYRHIPQLISPADAKIPRAGGIAPQCVPGTGLPSGTQTRSLRLPIYNPGELCNPIFFSGHGR